MSSRFGNSINAGVMLSNLTDKTQKKHFGVNSLQLL